MVIWLLLYYMCSANWVEIYGTKYQLPFSLVIDKTEDDDLVLGEVTQIYVVDNSYGLFEFILLETEFFLITMLMLYCYHQFFEGKVTSLSIKIYCTSIPLDCTIVML